MSKNSDSKKLFANSIYYSLGGVLSKGLHFFLLPVYTAFLSAEDYGVVNMVTSFNAVLHYLVLLCLDSAIMRYYALYQNEEKKLKRMYGTTITLVLFMCVVTFAGCFLFKQILLNTVFRGIEFFPYVLLGLSTLVLDCFSGLHRRMLQARQEGKKEALIGILTIACSSGLGVVFLAVFDMGASGMLLSTMIVSVGVAIYMLWDMLCRGMVEWCFERKLAGEMLRYSLPLIPHQLSGYLASMIGKVFLNTSGTLSAVGLYSIAVQFTAVTDTFQDSMSQAYRPWLNDQLRNSEKLDRERITVISQVLMAGCSVIYLGIAFFAKEMLIIMTAAEYWTAWKVIPFLVISYSIRIIFYFYLAQCLFHTESSKKIFIASVTANLSSIVFSAIFVPRFGMYGSAAASLLSIFINTTLIYLIDRPNGDIGYDLGAMIRVLLFAWIFIGVGIAPSYLIWPDEFSIVNFLYKGIIVCIYLVFLWYRHRNQIKQLTGIGDLKGAWTWIRGRNKRA